MIYGKDIDCSVKLLGCDVLFICLINCSYGVVKLILNNFVKIKNSLIYECILGFIF